MLRRMGTNVMVGQFHVERVNVTLLVRYSLRGGARGIDDRQIRETGLEGDDMVSSRSMAVLAPDAAVGRLGADQIMARTRVGHMVIEALHQTVPHVGRLPLKLMRVRVWDGSRRESSDPSLFLPPCHSTPAVRCGGRHSCPGRPSSGPGSASSG